MFLVHAKATSAKEERHGVLLLGSNPGGPSATLIAVAATYLEPENYDMESLGRLAKRPGDRETIIPALSAYLVSHGL